MRINNTDREIYFFAKTQNVQLEAQKMSYLLRLDPSRVVVDIDTSVIGILAIDYKKTWAKIENAGYLPRRYTLFKGFPR